jgi:hypothetical protein
LAPKRFYGVGVDCPPHLIGKPLIPDLYIRTRDVPEYFPPADLAEIERIVSYCIAVWSAR